MLFEHLIYSTAIAIIAGMLWYKHTGRDLFLVVISSVYALDFDIFTGELLKKLALNSLTTPIRHGDFHNIALLLLFATAATLVLRLAGMMFRDSFLFVGIGVEAQVFKEALIANRAYRSCWPITSKHKGLGQFSLQCMNILVMKTNLR